MAGLRLWAAAMTERRSQQSREDRVLAAGQLRIRSKRQGKAYVLGMSGELDLATTTQLEDELEAVEASDADEIIVDLSRLDFMDSTGLQVILAADARSKANGKRLKLVRGQRQVHRIFEITDTADRLPFGDR